ncbi:MBL fold metallo-hydrolase [Acetobacterium bakii]|uniref:Metallo-beta-lactamase domain-containing protein n=1 Tax=Acetobacterium bakii TaxID=52689 RepID=A0A0L6TX07_9FIRM|nr:MBL fold metallo-hydrolase [Acetobacterium bakii]KNZ40607.1 hypothetical protein AKG39_16815 [Acetobacterium bakii]
MKKTLFVMLLLVFVFLTGCTTNSSSLNTETKKATVVNGTMKVHFIDVGQGDAILIQQGESTMLIDAGDNQYGETVVNYLKDQGVQTLDYVIGTHPHADHIGGLDVVINNFEVKKIIMPKVGHTTKTYEDLLLAIKNKGLKITTPVVGETNDLGDSQFTIIGPNAESYNSLNDYSVAIKLAYGNTSFVFTGDAEENAEKEMLALGIDLKADVLKIPHHGSSSSLSDAFLKAVAPKIGVIQLGADNDYGHPHEETMAKLAGVELYRTDNNGTVVIESDGTNLSVKTQKAGNDTSTANTQKVVQQENTATTADTGSYIGNINSHVYHTVTCSSLPLEKNRVYFDTEEEAIAAGYRPHEECNK